MRLLRRRRCRFLVLAILAIFPEPTTGQDCARIAADYRQSIVLISVEKTRQQTGALTRSSGTGFIVSPEGYVLTAYHVIAPDPDTDDIKIDGSIGSLFATKSPLRIVADDKAADLALLQFRDTSRLYSPIPLGNPWKVAMGEQLCSLSFSALPAPQEFHVNTGTLSSRTGSDDVAGVRNLWTTQMPSNPGESGGPVFHLPNGGVVALKYGGKPPSQVQNVNYITPLNLAAQMLSTHCGITLANPDSLPSVAVPGSRLEKISGDQQVIPLGAWKSFSVKVVDGRGRPVVGAKVAWQTPAGGSLTFVGETDQDGLSSATQLYTFATTGTYTQLALLVPRNTPVGFGKAEDLPSVSSIATFIYQQK